MIYLPIYIRQGREGIIYIYYLINILFIIHTLINYNVFIYVYFIIKTALLFKISTYYSYIKYVIMFKKRYINGSVDE